jgi:hypothetical protein
MKTKARKGFEMKMLVLSAFAALSFGGCSQNIPSVTPEEYADLAKCWVRNGKFRSFVILSESNGSYFPYFVSPWCNVVAEDYPQGLGFVSHIKALSFSDDECILKKNLLFLHCLQSTTIVHSPLPKKDDLLFVYVGDVRKFSNDGFVYYRLSNPMIFKNTKISLATFIEMNPNKRQIFFQDSIDVNLD